MAKSRVVYQCSECHYTAPSYLGKCPECQSWNTFSEVREAKAPPAKPQHALRASLGAESKTQTLPTALSSQPLSAIRSETTPRLSTGISELDRVLGGGLLPGAYILVGGDPGIGKSTLMLQMAAKLGQSGHSVLYVAGEESAYQIRLRADRLGLPVDALRVYPETDIHQVIEEITSLRPMLVILDSVQSVYDPGIESAPGSVSQIKSCASTLMTVAKNLNVAIVLIGHVTKEGAVSGPKLLEHTVDAVLYFEGEKYKDLRILRTVKNRFGSTQEIGVFEMGETGLREVTNPSELFLSDEESRLMAGCVTVCTMEGSRPLLVEIQALVGHSAYATPRRVANGVEYNRLHQIVAVLERRLGLDFSQHDLYVNVVGGLSIDEPAADLGVAMAMITAKQNISMRPGTVVVGEIGLTGEIRPIRRAEDRIAEAAKIGFRQIILPRSGDRASSTQRRHGGNLEVVTVRTMMEAVTACLPADETASLSRSPREGFSEARRSRFPSRERAPLELEVLE
jgi:DNA repair protein RadA/Sms